MLILAVTILLLANSTEANILTTNIAYGQNKASSPSLSTTVSHKIKLHVVRITSPVGGQDVPVGKNLGRQAYQQQVDLPLNASFLF
jgi:hypothetical protein